MYSSWTGKCLVLFASFLADHLRLLLLQALTGSCTSSSSGSKRKLHQQCMTCKAAENLLCLSL